MSTIIRFKMSDDALDLKPAKAHADDAAYDLRSRTDLTVQPGKVTLAPTGLFLELPVGFEAQIRPRSGMALKFSMTLLNTPGTIVSVKPPRSVSSADNTSFKSLTKDLHS